MLETPVPIRTQKLSSIGKGQCLNGRLLETPGAAVMGSDTDDAQKCQSFTQLNEFQREYFQTIGPNRTQNPQTLNFLLISLKLLIQSNLTFQLSYLLVEAMSSSQTAMKLKTRVLSVVYIKLNTNCQQWYFTADKLIQTNLAAAHQGSIFSYIHFPSNRLSYPSFPHL